MRGGGKCSSPALTHRLRRPPLPKGEGYFFDDGFCEFTFGLAQNDRVGGMLVRVKVFGLEKPTQRKSVAMCVDFLKILRVLVRIVAMCIDCVLMMLSVLVLDCCHVHRFWVNSCL